MTIFGDLATDLDNLFDSTEAEATAKDAYYAYLVAPPALPETFADQAAYDAYASALSTWQGNCTSSLATWQGHITNITAYHAAIIARIPIAECWYTITRGGTTYKIGKFADANGNMALRRQVV